METNKIKPSLSARSQNDGDHDCFFIKVMGSVNSYLLHTHMDVQNGNGADPETGISPILINYTDNLEKACRITNPVFANLLCSMLNLTVSMDNSYQTTHCVIPSSMAIQKAPVTIPKPE